MSGGFVMETLIVQMLQVERFGGGWPLLSSFSSFARVLERSFTLLLLGQEQWRSREEKEISQAQRGSQLVLSLGLKAKEQTNKAGCRKHQRNQDNGSHNND
jgi:predicted lactoylglutathione lyase